MTELRERIRAAWQGRISGCQLGKPLEVLSMARGQDEVIEYLRKADALPLRDYVPLIADTMPARFGRESCKDHISRSEPDDDINYTVLALMMLEQHGLDLTTEDVARAWLRYLPAGAVFTAERAAYSTLLARADDFFGSDPSIRAGFDVTECAGNRYNDWIGAQIRADLYGWVCPGRPALAAELAGRDAALSHRGDGIYGAVFVAAIGAALPESSSIEDAVEQALEQIPSDSGAAGAVRMGRTLAGDRGGDAAIRAHYTDLSPVHTLNNLALVVWALVGNENFSDAIGSVVEAGLDTDCNGATVGGLWALRGKPIPSKWTEPWQQRVAVTLCGVDEFTLDDLVDRTVAVADQIRRRAD